jgi:Putative prokaryotic signal transducing protein
MMQHSFFARRSESMPEENPAYDPEPLVIAYLAGSPSEAMVIRGLLESAGISTPSGASADPFPLPESSENPSGVEILVLESQADEARAIIGEYQKGSAAKGVSSDD